MYTWLCAFLLCSFISVAQNKPLLNLEHLDANTGLPQGFVPSITQDEQGYIWLAGKHGVLRYDGYDYQRFDHHDNDTNSLSGNFINQVLFVKPYFVLALSSFGTIDAINTRTHLVHRCNTFPAFKANGDNKIGLLQHSDGTLYMYIDSTLYLCSFHSKGNEAPQLKFVKLANTHSAGADLCMGIDAQGNVYAYTPSAAGVASNLYCYDARSHALNKQVLKHSKPIINMYCLNNGELYFVDGSNNFLYNTTTQQKKQLPAGMQSGCSFTDNKSLIWSFTTEGASMYNTSNGVVSSIDLRNPQLLRFFKIKKLLTEVFIDQANTIWMATPGYGVFKFNKNFLAFDSYAPAANPSLYTMTMLGGDTVHIIDEENAQLFLPSQQRFIALPNYKENIPFAAATHRRFVVGRQIFVAIDSSSVAQLSLWGNVERSISLPTELQGQQIQFIDALNDNSYIVVCSDNSGMLVLYELNKYWQVQSSTKLFKQSVRNTNFVQEGLSDGKGKYYLATLDGLVAYQLKAKQATLIKAKNLQLPQYIQALSLHNNTLWLGTQGHGVVALDMNTLQAKNYTVAGGLPDSTVYQIQCNKQFVWLSTNKGLACIDLDSNAIYKYSAIDGLQDNEFNRYASCILPDGRMVFGGISGLSVFKPADALGLSFNSSIHITSVKIDQSDVSIKHSNNIDKDSFGVPQTIKIKHSEKFLQISFSLNDFSNTGQCVYSYLLEGFDNKWHTVVGKNFIELNNLPIGNYKLWVKGCNSKGVWSKPITITVIVISPWWRRWWAIALFIIAASMIVRSIVRYRIEQIKKVERIKNRISSDLHDEIGSSLTSLNIYNNLAQKYSSDKGVKYLQRSEVVLKDVIESLNDIVWSLNSRNETADSISKRFEVSSVVEALRLKGYKVNLSISESAKKIILGNEQRKSLLLCIKEACNNSLKYANGNKVDVHLDYYNKRMQVHISDNGDGFTIDSPKRGNGLLNMQERMHNIGGEAEITSVEKQGTKVMLSFPA
jgi:ligand-binding sensor domain-containing protein/two-component sensor histidine kinase